MRATILLMALLLPAAAQAQSYGPEAGAFGRAGITGGAINNTPIGATARRQARLPG